MKERGENQENETAGQSVCKDAGRGPARRGPELRPARGEGGPAEEVGVQCQVFKTQGWQRDAADRAVLEGGRHSRVRDECLSREQQHRCAISMQPFCKWMWSQQRSV